MVMPQFDFDLTTEIPEVRTERLKPLHLDRYLVLDLVEGEPQGEETTIAHTLARNGDVQFRWLTRPLVAAKRDNAYHTYLVPNGVQGPVL